MALQTTFTTATGTAVLTDAMAVGRNDRGHDLGAGSPGVLLRRVECSRGSVDIEVEYAPRPEYGLIHPILQAVLGGLATRAGADRLLVSAPVGFRVDGATATASLRLEASPSAGCALHHGRIWDPSLVVWDQDQIAARLEDTLGGWRSWSAIHQTYEGPWRDLVHHSGRVLHALTFQPTAPSSPRPPPRCPRRSAASATGTTATPGSGTPASAWRPCGSRPAR
jgi:alpha,alpha-trehalase